MKRRAMAVLLSLVMGTTLLQPAVSLAAGEVGSSGTIKEWTWATQDENLTQDLDTGAWTLTAEASEAAPLTWEELEAMLPQAISAVVEAPEPETTPDVSEEPAKKEKPVEEEPAKEEPTEEEGPAEEGTGDKGGEGAEEEQTDENEEADKEEVAEEKTGGSAQPAALALPAALYLQNGEEPQTENIGVTWTKPEGYPEKGAYTGTYTLTPTVAGSYAFAEGTVPQVTVEIQTAADSTNPTFTVQYYAYLDEIDTEHPDGYLTILDTSGGKLPTNDSQAVDTKRFYLNEVDGGKYEVATKEVLTEVYQAYQYNFENSNQMEKINRLSANGNYELESVWALKGDDADSIAEGDWETYDPDSVRFTNNPDTVDNTTVLIQDGTVIRLVYRPTDDQYENDAHFYDYDITDGNGYTNINGAAQGINSPKNYEENFEEGDAKLAFGNANTGTGLENEKWDGNTLNKKNENSQYEGCTYELVTGLDKNGNLQYAEGVAAPNLFNDGEATGKTAYMDKYSLVFNRSGDTYTLTAVEGTKLKDLEKFTELTAYKNGTSFNKSIWTNNFWPMDEVQNADPHTGDCYKRQDLVGASGKSQWPISDDSIDHNNLFGMQYAIEFDLSEDYCGPLEYYFFGDDDMWVFLTDQKTGKSQLVCDIGGVHSSVGEYVNLWDYIEKGSAGGYTLTFFYTERGLSGSTCWMQFTLPSVSSAIPGQITESLTVEKKVVGGSDREFEFTIELKDEDGQALPNSYSTKKSDGTTGTITSGGTFTLCGGESITISGLPVGTRYTVTETKDEDFVTSVGREETNTASGEIKVDETVTFTNTELGNLTVSKTVAGSGADRNQDFTFTVTLDDKTIDGAYGDMTFENGVATFTLRDGQSKTAEGLPDGTEYTVTESGNGGYEVTSKGETGVIAAGETVKAAFTNTKEEEPDPGPDPGPGPSDPTGKLTISKRVTGAGDPAREFTFRVDFTLESGSTPGTRYSFHGDKSGTIRSGETVTLRGGESITIAGIPAGTHYVVTELEANEDGYTTTATGEEGTIREDKTAQASFVNDLTDAPDNPPDNPPDEPDIPDEPDVPVEPDDPDTPDQPDVPREPDTPEEPDEPGLPQTGQLWWPVGLLAAAGAALMLLGVWGKTRYHGKHEA